MDSPESKTRLTIIGAGYVGIASALAFERAGHEVVCVERDQKKLAELRARRDPLGEPGVEQVLESSRTLFVERDDAMERSEFVFVAVGTPMSAGGRPDLAQLDAAVAEIARRARAGCIVVIRSTVPVGTCERLQQGPLRHMSVLSHPEFLRVGHVLEDVFAPSRIVIGGPTEARGRLASLYERMTSSTRADGLTRRPEVVLTDTRSAELAKYASNAFLATKLSFVNEIASLTALLDADIRSVLRTMALDPRIGGDHLSPGLGWGGSCFPKDTRALQAMADGEGFDFSVLKAAIEQNNRQLGSFVEAIVAETAPGERIAVLGLAFKAGTSDTRESPALSVVSGLVRQGRLVTAFDPMVKRAPAGIDGLVLAPDPYAAAEGAVALVLATEWKEFTQLDLVRLRATMHGNLVFDGRMLLDAGAVASAGLRYRGFGTWPRRDAVVRIA